ncbi:MAG: GIY-YIG nuclease family protein [Candidatus Acidiferrales bacterium]
MGSNPIGSTRICPVAFYVYILQSQKTGHFYVGQTKDLPARLQYHNANYSLSLRNKGLWKLMHQEEYSTRAEAVRRERYIKHQKDRQFIESLLSASR